MTAWPRRQLDASCARDGRPRACPRGIEGENVDRLGAVRGIEAPVVTQSGWSSGSDGGWRLEVRPIGPPPPLARGDPDPPELQPPEPEVSA
jgi:hypothetical protein